MVNTEIILIIFFEAKDGAALVSQRKQDCELTVAQIMNSDHIGKFRFEESTGKNTRSFRYDLNQIPYDYIVEVTNRFKGLDLIDRVSEKLWMEVRDIVQEVVIKTISKKKKCKKAKWFSEEALQIAENRRDVKGKGENQRYTHLNTGFQRIARRDKKAFLSE